MKAFDAEKARILASVQNIWPGLPAEDALVRMILLHEQTIGQSRDLYERWERAEAQNRDLVARLNAAGLSAYGPSGAKAA